MASDFKAFESTAILTVHKQKIQDLVCWDSRLLAALDDGTLLVIGRQEATESPEGRPWQVHRILKGFGKKYLLNLQVVRTRTALLSASDEGINLHTLPRLQLTAQATRTRGANCFAWDESKGMLAAACRKRVQLLQYDGRDFLEVRELGMSDIPLTMKWAGDSLAIGFKRECYLVHSISGTATEIIATGRLGRPHILSLPSAELLVGHDNVSSFVGHDGKQLHKKSLSWSEPPSAVVYTEPYIIAQLSHSLQARLASSRIMAQELCQNLDIPGATALTVSSQVNGSVFVACQAGTQSSIHHLVAVPLDQQAEALADLGDFLSALELACLLPESQAGVRHKLEEALRVRYGYHLFASDDINQGMAQIGISASASPLVLLNLLPSLTPPSVLEPLELLLEDMVAECKLPEVQEPTGDAYQAAVSAILPYLIGHRSRLQAFEAPGSPRKMQSKQGFSQFELQHQGSADEQGHPVISDGNDSLTDMESPAGSLQSHQLSPSQSVLQASTYMSGMEEKDRSHLSTLVDTAIIKAMLLMDDTGSLLRFVQRPNSVDLAEGCHILRSAGRYSELVALLQQHAQYDQALDLLRNLSQDPSRLEVPPRGAAADLKGLPGVWSAAKMLAAIGPKQLDVLWHHARWILKADPDHGLAMLLEMRPSLAPEVVVQMLNAFAPAFCAQYLETAMDEGIAKEQDFQTELAMIYLRLALDGGQQHPDAGQQGSSNHRADTPGQSMAHQRLKTMILTGKFVDHGRLLRVVPTTSLLEIRALLLERLGRHHEALRIYVHQLDSPLLAEEYCDRLYEAKINGLKANLQPMPDTWAGVEPEASYDMYIALMQVYLEADSRGYPDRSASASGASTSQSWERVCQLLSRKQDRIEPLKALSLLPGEVPLHVVLPFVKSSLRTLGEQKRTLAVVKGLSRAQDLESREKLTVCKKRNVLLSFERACAFCHKRIGNTAFTLQLIHHPNIACIGVSGLGAHSPEALLESYCPVQRSMSSLLQEGRAQQISLWRVDCKCSALKLGYFCVVFYAVEEHACINCRQSLVCFKSAFLPSDHVP
ncbi:hypothetical protein WJX84_002836 [Apatococcus fuscideae]